MSTILILLTIITIATVVLIFQKDEIKELIENIQELVDSLKRYSYEVISWIPQGAILNTNYYALLAIMVGPSP